MTKKNDSHTGKSGMTKEKALEFVASELARGAVVHLQAAKKFPTMEHNTRQALATRVEVAKALGIEDVYMAKFNLHSGG